ncbi:MAG: DUF309 domain-containing protein [Bacteroidetes bacterium]|nr:DUF309 domain-containing protein [Bacteroidota bacterium]
MQDLILSGWDLFKNQDFFEAHDQWEEAWQEMSGNRRMFWQAMIQLSVSAYHALNNHPSGAISQARKALTKFQSIPGLSNRSDVRELASLTSEWILILEKASFPEIRLFTETRLSSVPETILSI